MTDITPTTSPITRHIAMLAFPDCQILDVCGPLEVFSFVNCWLHLTYNPDWTAYRFSVVAERAGPIRTMSGLQIIADHDLADVGDDIDTLLVTGGIGVDRARDNPVLVDWVRSMDQRVRRLGSVCTGAFLLAEAGLLNGCRATTHWHWCQQLAEEYPDIRVEPDRLAIRDGSRYSSGGVTAGMDLALCMIEEDFGPEATSMVGRWMLVFPNRPGGQSQFNVALHNSSGARRDFRELQTWIDAHPEANLSVDALARRMHMSPRNFARLFEREVRLTPAKFVEQSRLDKARAWLENSLSPVEMIAEKCGFGGTEAMRRCFQRNFKVSPLVYRSRFRRGGVL
ncbi:GlxA family transcriptional regulator [Sorangium sp. So ce1389]|uniref:GlxA family transcriptional regulator n=1 Tax=Sorangium sp. So ce1389 TaxID=3133336 RepID=UPI003F61D884